MSIPFKKTYYDESQIRLFQDALQNGTDYIAKTKTALAAIYGRQIFMTSSASSAFDLLFTALELPHGSEVILPSFTYPSAANTALRYGLVPVFAEVDRDTKVLDISDVARKITGKTRCVIPTHYGGASCDFDALRSICKDILIVEDAALSFGASYNGKPLGTIGDFGIISFHHTKNISADQGGMLIVNIQDNEVMHHIQRLYDNGTDKAAFMQGQVDEYTWQTAGFGVTMPNVNAAILCAHLRKAHYIKDAQQNVCQYYLDMLSDIHDLALPHVPNFNTDNYHVFYIMLKDIKQREHVRLYLKDQSISAYFHYSPLHSSPMGASLGYCVSDLPVTQRISECVLRLPVYADLSEEECYAVICAIQEALKT